MADYDTPADAGAEPAPDLERGEGAYDLEAGYELTTVLHGLSYPTNVEFDGDGNVYVAEAGFTYPFVYKKARILRVTPEGKTERVAEGFHGPLIGLTWHEGAFLVTHRGTLSRVSLDGHREDLVTDLPSFGDHHTNQIQVINGKVYFGQGTVTNSGLVGSDSVTIFGWLVKHPDGHDVPAHDVVLSGANHEGIHPIKLIEKATTGAFLPLGTPSTPGQVIEGQLKATGVLYRCNPDGSDLEVVAWGLRNPYGLGTDGHGRILIVEQGADARGSRPVETPDALYELVEGGWYGWPDYYAGRPITDYQPDAQFLLAEHPSPVIQPLHLFEEHSCAVSIDVSRSASFGHEGHAFVAQWGSEAPFTTGGRPVSAGRSIVRLDLASMTERPFFKSRTVAGIGRAPHRPIMARFSPDGSMLYVLDHGVRTIPKSGGLWTIRRSD